MLEDFVFEPQAVTLENLSYLTREQSALEEQRILEISDMASDAASLSSELSSLGLGVVEALTYISSGVRFGELSTHESPLLGNVDCISSYLSSLHEGDKAIFAECYLKSIGNIGMEINEGSFLSPTASDRGLITYVRNAFSDEAYDVLSEPFDDARVRYSKDFRECARALSEGNADFCILPLEERGGARLQAVEQLLYRYDLKINSVTPVFGPDGNADVKYALISKGFSIHPFVDGDDRYLEIRLPDTAAGDVGALLGAATHFGMTLYRVNTVLYESEGGVSPHFSIVLRDEGRTFTALLTYLTLFQPEYIAVGMYKNLE